ncbi:unnamed protein product [Moneuplotes crassus]|uniref:Uncharacterized protein n=1 Tax=Euplotes crassus TaxID=5936 RepID=A0AAD2D3G0_EUPCR|nr:unnamed protein product [Moneuplotes crassus]
MESSETLDLKALVKLAKPHLPREHYNMLKRGQLVVKFKYMCMDYQQNVDFVKEVIEKLGQEKLPLLGGIDFGGITDETHELVLKILSEHFPDEIPHLFLDWYSKDGEIKAFLEVFSSISERVPKTLFIGNRNLSNTEFCELFHIFCKTETLEFRNVEIAGEAFDFNSDASYSIKRIIFTSCCETEGWGDLTQFSSIIEGISKTGLKDSLETITFEECPTIDVDMVQDVLNKKEMSHIMLEVHDDESDY